MSVRTTLKTLTQWRGKALQSGTVPGQQLSPDGQVGLNSSDRLILELAKSQELTDRGKILLGVRAENDQKILKEQAEADARRVEARRVIIHEVCRGLTILVLDLAIIVGLGTIAAMLLFHGRAATVGIHLTWIKAGSIAGAALSVASFFAWLYKKLTK
jgi:hypothetical protein